MVYREIIAVCSQIHTKHINTLCGQKVESLNVKLVVHIVTAVLYIVTVICNVTSGGMCSDHPIPWYCGHQYRCVLWRRRLSRFFVHLGPIRAGQTPNS